MSIDLTQALEDAVSWAKDAGMLQKRLFRSNFLQIETKELVSDLVTEADRGSESLILAGIQKSYPSFNVLAEESGEKGSGSDWCWVIDPLDGTNNFASGLPIFCVSIALQYQQESILGVVYVPILNELFTAIKGQGAFLNRQKISVKKVEELKVSILGTGFPYDRKNYDNNSRHVAHMIGETRGIRRMGAAAVDLAYVAAGFLDGYWELDLRPWDMAAGTLLVEEAGGQVVSLRGSQKIAIATANPVLLSKLQAEIKKIDSILFN